MQDVPFSVPAILGRSGVERILHVGLSEEEIQGLSKSTGVITDAIENLKG